MRSLERPFKNMMERNPLWGSYMCFAKVVRGAHFNEQTINRWFHKLVDRQDYDWSGKKGILAHLHNLTNMPEDNKK